MSKQWRITSTHTDGYMQRLGTKILFADNELQKQSILADLLNKDAVITVVIEEREVGEWTNPERCVKEWVKY